ncbi:MAG TPA: gliding motility-associated ABC transporter ATP-binding subunit GldA [Flavitalea sp.]|nr:gliding motility-associated ABC transporter ATP-binding subunit GldA [Flavitalea sp.]
MSIEVRGLTKLYGEQKAVNDISFSITGGEIVGFLGPNGAGKSTTMKIITGYLQPDDGEAYVCGLSVKQQPLNTKKKTGYLPEANPLYYEMYVREYLDFIAEVHQVEKRKLRIEEVISTVGLTIESRKKIGQLSKGYKQRVGLAASLIHEPEVLILDEPTTGLDPNQILEIREVIKNLGQEKTILFSSHILQEVEAICDRVIIINKGQLVADDRLSKLQQKNQQQQFVSVHFKEPVSIEWMQQLTEVVKTEMVQPSQFRIYTQSPELVKKQLLHHSLQDNLNILSLQSGEQSLEEVFRELTK